MDLTFNPYTDNERHNTHRHRQTDGQTDQRQYRANSRSYCSAKKTMKVERAKKSQTASLITLTLQLPGGPHSDPEGLIRPPYFKILDAPSVMSLLVRSH